VGLIITEPWNRTIGKAGNFGENLRIRTRNHKKKRRTRTGEYVIMDYQGVEELLAIYCEANKEKIYKQNPEDIKQGMREYLREKLMSNCTSEDAQKNKEEMVQIHEWVEDFYKNMIKKKSIIKKINTPRSTYQ
jgi:antirestriction protein